MSYLLYRFNQGSANIQNYGTGGASYNGQASSAVQINKDSVTLTDNQARINVPGGISSPNQHTWQFHCVVNRFWPVLGVVDGVLCGNDGKLWSIASDTAYGYIHEEGTYPPLQETNIHHFSVEIAGAGGAGEDNVQFYLGVNGAKPVRITTGGDQGDEGGRHWWDFNYDIQLGVDYFFQVAINLPGYLANDYIIGNCAAGCADAMVSGFPCGCTLYSWREDNVALDLSTGGNWSEDMHGVTPPPPKPKPPEPDIIGAISEILLE